MVKQLTIAIYSALAISAMAGCTTHSPKIQASIDEATSQFEGGYDEQVKKYKPIRTEIGKVHNGFAYHDINSYSIIQRDQRLLPQEFFKPASIKELKDGNTYTVDEFSAQIYEAYGILLDVSSPELSRLASDSDMGMGFSSGGSLSPFMPLINSVDPGVAVAADSAGTYSAESQKGPAGGVNRDLLRLKPFRHKGTLKSLLDYVAQLNGLRWSYDSSYNKAYLYAFETQTFKIVDNGSKASSNTAISSGGSQTSSGDSGNTSGGSSMASTHEKTSDNWASIESAVNGMLSPEFGKATYNKKAGLVTVRDSDYNLREVKRYVDALNKSSTSLVVLEAKIIRFKYDDSDNHAINQTYLNDKLRSNVLGSFDMSMGLGSMSPDISGNLGAFQELMKGNFLTLASESSKFLIGFLNTIGTAQVAYSTQLEIMNNESMSDQMQATEEYISSIERSSYPGDGNGQQSITTERDVAIDGASLTVQPRIVDNNVYVEFYINQTDFIALKDAGLGAGSEGVKLKTQSALNFRNVVSLQNGIPKVVKFTHQRDVSTSSQGMLDDLLWFLGGNETRSESNNAVLLVMTAYLVN